MPPLHPLIIHFPIALFVIAVLFDGITAITQKDSLVSATKLLYIFGYLGTLAALITGDMLKHQRAAVLPHTLLTLHEWLAIAFAVWFTVLLTVRLRRYWEPSKPYAAVAVVGLLLLIAVGHTGGSMAWPSLKSSVAVSTAGAGNPATSTSNGSDSTSQSTTSSNPTGSAAKSSVSSSQSKSDSATASNAGSSSNPNSSSNAGNSSNSNSSSNARSSSNSNSSSNAGSSSNSKSTSSSSSSAALIQVGQQYFVQDCQSCHSLGVAQQYFGHLSKSNWTSVVQTMQSYAGGAIPDNQAQAIIAYVSSQP